MMEDQILWAFNYVRNRYGGRPADPIDYGFTSPDSSRSTGGDTRPEYLGWQP